MAVERAKGLAAIALGSNLNSAAGDREANLREAIERLGTLGEVRAVSSFYDTEPVGYTAQPRFLNGALLLETELPPEKLIRALLAIERAMGRVRDAAAPKGPRVIDLDLLLYGDAVMNTEELTLPHPAIAEREFVLGPLAEIAPGMIHPVLGLTVSEMLDRLRTSSM
ncbi:2-amino-4-hydroxy-6-hydroxymethyldihydropteridine diphosphokinase [Edaphobacter sp.]|uniref:2-amino-4-hydroxy-6- hydroxymethyldihydropteridine diphosphokinase n=1 Tax=Edaphobacter sp. TaxID=1934404 RepID=UPI002DB87837|nr:2-amino-4-hydroxy-6-hydroxymethyldihydropteridine diphosphokinase [Edaphobacter sp.]HEU5342563.1 2-amino-4-hydroxy-6-hydroxymethyldihydropteridine diphosphokinase [Edaphobacter sp.]